MDEEHCYFFEGEEIDEEHLQDSFQHQRSPASNPCLPFAEKIVSSKKDYKAMKTEEMFKDYPPNLQKNFLSQLHNKKYLTGIQGIIGLSVGGNNQDNQFLQQIDSEVFNPSERENYKNLQDLFKTKMEHSPQMQITLQLEELTKRISEVQKKTFNSISMNKTIGKAFTEHFDNFLYLREQSTFLSLFNQSFENFLTQAKQINTPGINLITLIYDFWMKMFKEFVREIWKHSEKYTLGLFKKQKGQSTQHNSVKSTKSSSQTGGLQKQKRKPWTKSELEIIQKIIDANGVFSQARLKQLGEEFGRTPCSISSKVQKILKNKKKGNIEEEDEKEDVSIEAKIKYILEMHPKGLTKQTIIESMNENYEMGMDESWKNSVSSLLSSSPKFMRVKMPYKLKNPMFYINYAFSSTLKDKIIQCLLNLSNQEGEIKDIVQEYTRIFCNGPEIEQRKQIEQSISKTLSRYDIFERQNTKIVYKLAPNSSQFYFDNELDLKEMLSFG